MSDRFTIRLATLDDVDAIAEHRTRMFEEMGEVPPETRLDRLVLHAAEAGRSLYRRLGFVETNEMRLAGE
jgi:hypothetical protein